MWKRATCAVCTVLLIAAACDESELPEDALLVEGDEADAEARAAPDAAESADESVRLGGCATFYEHINFGGDSRDVRVGAYVHWIGGPWNDQISSLKVRSGCVFNAYEHIDFGGDHTVFAGWVPWVGNGWNDRISSYTCSC